MDAINPGEVWVNRFASDNDKNGNPREITIISVDGPFSINPQVRVQGKTRRQIMRVSTLLDRFVKKDPS